MTPKAKADELIVEFYYTDKIQAKQCALKSVVEILKALNDDIYIQGETDIDSHIDYWQDVKRALEEI